METKANYLLIGVFTLLGFLGLLGFVAWFSKIELDKQFAYYDVYFDNVSGLDRASTVKFAGLSVGQVSDLALSDAGDGTVRVRLEVAADTPVRIDSEATIEAQGVTGVSYVGISSGTPETARLTAPGGDTPVITAGKSALQTLTQDAPAVIDEALKAMEQINTFLSDENRQNVDTILTNLAEGSEKLNTTLDAFSMVAHDVGTSVNEIARFTTELEGIAQSVSGTLDLAGSAIRAIDDFAIKAQVTLDAATDTIEIAGNFIDGEFTTAITDLTETSGAVRDGVTQLSQDANALLTTWEKTGAAATARLTQAETLLSDTSNMIVDLVRTLESVDAAAVTFDTLIASDGTSLFAEARTLVNSADTALQPLTAAIETDLPAILHSVTSAARTTETTIASMGADLSAAAGRVDGLTSDAQTALRQVTETFARANQTMDVLDRALGVAETTLTSAQGAFEGAEKIVNQDISPITEGLNGSISRLNAALDQVNDDIPAVTQSLRSAAETADRAAARFMGMLNNANGPINSFVKDGLPQYTYLANEARKLVKVMESIAAKIERDPARFMLGGDTPTYRRR